MVSRLWTAAAAIGCLAAALSQPVFAEPNEGASSADAPQLLAPGMPPSPAPPSDSVPFQAEPGFAIQTRMMMVTECNENAVGKGCWQHEIPVFSLVPVKPADGKHAQVL